jgi:glycolate dehydrogenase iron-sulfur subunit
VSTSASTVGDARSNPVKEAWLDCVHCGLCLSSCPTYRVLGNEMDSPRGRIYLMRALDEGRAEITDTFSEHMFRCLDCRACETACPSGVQFGQMMEATRGRIVARRGTDRLQRFLLEYVFPSPTRFQVAAHLYELYRRSGVSSFLRSTDWFRRIAPAQAQAEQMAPEVPLTRGVGRGSVYPAIGRARGRVAFLTGCVMNSYLGSVNRASVGLVQAAGFDVLVPEAQICCGALANHAGLRETARQMAQRNLEAFPLEEVEQILVNASGCGAMLAEYPTLIGGAEAFSMKVVDLATFLDRSGTGEQLSVPLPLRVGYDDPCHLVHAQGVRQPPRSLLAAIPGIDLVEIEGADECCGSAGIYNLTQPDLSMAILDRKMERVAAAGLDILVTSNPGCMFQLQYGARRKGLELEVVHLAEVLVRSLPESLRDRAI